MATTEVANKVKYGLSDVYYAKLNADGTYEKPVPIPGAVSVSLKAAGSSVTAYGDNVAQVDFTDNQGYTGSIAFNLIPDQFKIDILGDTVDENGVIGENSDEQPCEFALLFQFLLDKRNRRHVFYRCKASRPDISSETKKDKTDIKEESLDLTVRPLANALKNGKLKHQVKNSVENTEDNHEIYENWYTEVYGSHVDETTTNG